MELAKKLVDEYNRSRTYRLLTFDSKSQPGKVWEARVYYGCNPQSPALSCTCPGGKFGMCSHKQKLLDSLRGVDWMFIEHHDENMSRWR